MRSIYFSTNVLLKVDQSTIKRKFCIDQILEHVRWFNSSNDLECVTNPTQRDASQEHHEYTRRTSNRCFEGCLRRPERKNRVNQIDRNENVLPIWLFLLLVCCWLISTRQGRWVGRSSSWSQYRYHLHLPCRGRNGGRCCCWLSTGRSKWKKTTIKITASEAKYRLRFVSFREWWSRLRCYRCC